MGDRTAALNREGVCAYAPVCSYMYVCVGRSVKRGWSNEKRILRTGAT